MKHQLVQTNKVAGPLRLSSFCKCGRSRDESSHTWALIKRSSFVWISSVVVLLLLIFFLLRICPKHFKNSRSCHAVGSVNSSKLSVPWSNPKSCSKKAFHVPLVSVRRYDTTISLWFRSDGLVSSQKAFALGEVAVVVIVAVLVLLLRLLSLGVLGTVDVVVVISCGGGEYNSGSLTLHVTNRTNGTWFGTIIGTKMCKTDSFHWSMTKSKRSIPWVGLTPWDSKKPRIPTASHPGPQPMLTIC